MFNPNFPFDLPPLPPKVDFEDKRILKALIGAHKEIGALKGRSLSLPNPMLLMSAAMTKESVESSRIEGINTTVESLLEGEAIPEASLSKENKEALRYKHAIEWGHSNLKSYSLSTRLIQGIQKTLLESSQGKYRLQQNSIQNDLLKEKIYTPPAANQISNLMNNWENFANKHDDGIDPLIKIALCHYQFEAIHPFGDGNGRTGRILMVLQMVETGLLNFPVLYISGFLNKHRENYYKSLRLVTEQQDWIGYLEFMIIGFENQALKTQLKLAHMIKLHSEIEARIRKAKPKIKSQELTDHLFSAVFTSPTKLSVALGVNYQTASKYLLALEQEKIVVSRKVGKYHLFCSPELLKMVI